MWPAAPAVFFKLWVAKKLAVMLALRVYGLKKLYRGGLRLNDRFVADQWSHGKIKSVMHGMAAGAMVRANASTARDAAGPRSAPTHDCPTA